MEESPLFNQDNSNDFNQKTFNIISNKENNFSLSISTIDSNTLLLYCEHKENLIFHIFSSELKTVDIKKNKYFLMFDNIEEIFNEFCYLFNNNKPSIIEDTNKILLFIPLSTSKFKELIIEIKEKEKNDKEKIEELYKIISNLQEQILLNNNENNFKKEINELTSKIEKQNKEIEELKKIIKENQKNIESWIDFKKKKEEKYKNETILNLDSLIINNNLKYNITLKNWINPNKNIKIKSQLLYRLSRDGNSYDIFHKYCDNKGPTLTLIQAVEGFKTGGFTLLNWDSNSQWKKDKDTFIFSLTENKKFVQNNSNRGSIYCLNSYGPWFDDFGFEDDRKNEKKFMKQCKFQTGNAFLNANEIIPNDGKDKYFDVKEVEVYKIIFD